MRYGSACSGIEAASAAWHHLGWQAVFFSEIEPFPRAVLAARWPGVPIHGDFTTIEKDTYEPIDLLVCGTPCQDFSVAGLRAGLAGERGFLTIEFVRLAERLRPRWLVWENVPGVLSSDDGRAFGLFLGALGECGYGTAWRVLDAQHFGVPQRRRRVFVVGYLGDWRPPAAVLFERESLRGDPPPRRTPGEGVADHLAVGANQYSGFCGEPVGGLEIANPLGAKADGGWRGDLDNDTYVAACLTARDAKGSDSDTHLIAFQANAGRDFTSDDDRSPPLRSEGIGGTSGVAIAFDARQSDTLVYGDKTGPLDTDAFSIGVVTHSLRAEGFDASEDGTGRGVPLTLAFDPRQIGHPANHSNPKPGDPCHPLRGVANAEPAVLTLAIRGRGDSHDLEYRQDGIANAILTPNGGRAGIGVGAVAVPIQCNGTNVGTGLPSLRAGNGHITGGGPANAYGIRRDAARDGTARTPSPDAEGRVRLRDPGFNVYEETAPTLDAAPHAVAFAQNMHGEVREMPYSGGLKAEHGMNETSYIRQAMSVRRLTPVECERLQGFPDDYTLITYRKKPAADGPRYRALGNSMAVPCMRWIGERIALVEELL